MRKLPDDLQNADIEPQWKDDRESYIKQERTYRLITPLFGGGVNPNEHDEITVIRGTEVRAQLRFWWRACRAAAYDLKTLKAREDLIWGRAYKKGDTPPRHGETVQIVVQADEKRTAIKPYDKRSYPKQPPVPSYAAFPLQPSQEDRRLRNPYKEIQDDISFQLTLSFPKKYEEDIEAALWAWETFGGIGARTRRSFGALELLHIKDDKGGDEQIHPIPADRQAAKDLLTEMLILHVSEGTIAHKDVPHLTRNTKFDLIYPKNDKNVRDESEVIKAWSASIAKLAAFRKMGNVRTGNDRFAASRWPEATAIRALTDNRQQDNKDRQARFRDKFPRAFFGLPIIFHFPDEHIDATLQGKGTEQSRLASPLIIRPLACQNGRALGLALLLEGCNLPPGELELIWDKEDKQSRQVRRATEEVKALIQADEMRHLGLPPLKKEENAQKALLEAFINYFGG